ncbi:MAG: S8 family serine peptidase, partial [Anaerolineales bacterium]
MKSKLLKLLTFAMLISLIALPVSARSPQGNLSQFDSKSTQASVNQDGAILLESDGQEDSAPKTSDRLIVELESPPLAEWARLNDIAIQKNGKVNINSIDAQAYVSQLETEQAAFINNMTVALPDAAVSQYINELGARIDLSYQLTFNGMAIETGATPKEEAQRILTNLPGVKAVYFDYAHEPELYASVPLINAEAAWNDPTIGGMENAGAGIKVASMDGGVHHDAPMFDGTGYDYPLGYPPNGLGLTENNNGKIIASRVYFRTWDPPSPGDENPWPGTQGTPHGNHTSSIAAGNEVVADYLGITETISGVAPNAWVMSYRVFYNSITNEGSFYTAEGIAALEDIMMDGADVLNNSWGGGPGSAGGAFDPLDQALINVANAGTFVSMSTGNAGPGNGTTDHPSDEYINVAASTTEGTYLAGRLNVIAPEPVPDDLMALPFGRALFGDPIPIADVISYTFTTAYHEDATNVEGCDPWTGTPFTGNAVLISRGTCNFSQKVFYAQEAGADFAVIYNNAGDGLINMAAGDFADQVTIPSLFVGQTDGEGMVDWYDTYGTASVLELDTLAFQAGNVPDIIASFSSRGPGVGNVLKPDITAPGVNILAQGYDPTATGEDRHLGFGQNSGTSMAAPHVAGAAALLRQIHPTWSNGAIKSALMSTSKYVGVWNGDGSHAQPLDMGAGRLDLTNAADPGVILYPPSLSFGVVPTGTMETIDVMVTSVADTSETYMIATQLITGTNFTNTTTTALPGFTVDPVSLTLDPGETATVSVTFDTTEGTIGDNQGHILMDGTEHDAHMPAWARVTPEPSADVLIIDNDFSALLGYPHYLSYYTDTLDNLGITYDVWDADLHYNNPTTLPDPAVLMTYKAVIYFTGDNFWPDGSFTVSTPLTALDQNILTEYANSGGILIAMGQDLASVLGSAAFDAGTFFYGSVLGGN